MRPPMHADHPRACGANSDGHRGEWGPDGSSPRVRGKPVPSVVSTERIRIIPARAGQTMRGAGQRLHPSDHPRACGANPFSGLAVALIAGSSPRVRGKQERAGLAGVLVRIIPARAGQTEKTNRPAAQSPDHPRACGANLPFHARQRLHAGSSPRVRGKPARPARAPPPVRIIPARAGQTTAR